jgi:hypothetical protein
MVAKERFELSRPYGHYALNVARLPFRHFARRLYQHYIVATKRGLFKVLTSVLQTKRAGFAPPSVLPKIGTED